VRWIQATQPVTLYSPRAHDEDAPGRTCALGRNSARHGLTRCGPRRPRIVDRPCKPEWLQSSGARGRVSLDKGPREQQRVALLSHFQPGLLDGQAVGQAPCLLFLQGLLGLMSVMQVHQVTAGQSQYYKHQWHEDACRKGQKPLPDHEPGQRNRLRQTVSEGTQRPDCNMEGLRPRASVLLYPVISVNARLTAMMRGSRLVMNTPSRVEASTAAAWLRVSWSHSLVTARDVRRVNSDPGDQKQEWQ